MSMELPMKNGGLWLAAALKHVRDGVACVDRAGEIVWMNPAAKRLLGLQEIPGANPAAGAFFDSLEKEPRNPLGSALRSVLDADATAAGIETHVSCHELFCAGDRHLYVDYTIVPVFQGGECRGAVIVLSENASCESDIAPHPEASGAEPDTSVVDTARVLVMDDDEVVRNLTVQKLVRLGYESDGASNGEEAVSKFKTARDSGRPFGVVVLDLFIRGGMGGKETLEKLQGIDPGVKAILTSGHAVDPMLTNFWEYGFFGVVRKPFVIKELDVAIRRAFAEE